MERKETIGSSPIILRYIILMLYSARGKCHKLAIVVEVKYH